MEPTATTQPTATPRPTRTPSPTFTPAPTLTREPTRTPLPSSPLAGLQNDRWIASSHPALTASIKSQSWVTDGVTEMERDALQQLLWITAVEENHAWNLLQMPWLEDGPNQREIDAIQQLDWTTQTSSDLGDQLWQKPWFQDEVIATAMQILDMPFLDSVESLDAMAVRSLAQIERYDTSGFLEMMSHPKLSDGITDEEAKS